MTEFNDNNDFPLDAEILTSFAPLATNENNQNNLLWSDLDEVLGGNSTFSIPWEDQETNHEFPFSLNQDVPHKRPLDNSNNTIEQPNKKLAVTSDVTIDTETKTNKILDENLQLINLMRENLVNAKVSENIDLMKQFHGNLTSAFKV